MDSYGVDEFVAYNADTTSEHNAFPSQANQLCVSPTPFDRRVSRHGPTGEDH